MVASEVRNLAQRSASAAKEIKHLIGDSVEKIQAGNKLVEDAGLTMVEIVTSVKRATNIMSEITTASMEQTNGINQVNQAISQIDEITQQNAALVEEAAAAAVSLAEQAVKLSQAVSVFKFAQTSEAMRSIPVTTRRPHLTLLTIESKQATGKNRPALSKRTAAPRGVTYQLH